MPSVHGPWVWVPNTLRTSCDLLLLVEQSAEAVTSPNSEIIVTVQVTGRSRRSSSRSQQRVRLTVAAARTTPERELRPHLQRQDEMSAVVDSLVVRLGERS